MTWMQGFTTKTTEETARLEIAQGWIDDLEFLRDKFTGKSYRDLDLALGYVQDLAGFGIPKPNGDIWNLAWWGAEYKNKRNFFLTPLLEQDTKLGPALAEFIKRPCYFRPLKAIFLPPDLMTREWRALVLNHEVCHTIAHNNRWFRNQKLSHWSEEHSVFTQQAYWASKVYGQPYLKKVRSLSKKFERMWRAKNLDFKSYEVATDAEMSQIFGLALSRMELEEQRTIVVLDALYRMINRLFKPGRLRDKHHRQLTFWYCDFPNYQKYREAEKQRKADKAKTK